MSYSDAYRRKRSSSRHNNSSANDSTAGRDSRSFGGAAGSTVQSVAGETRGGGYSSLHNKTDPDNTMLAKEREIEEKHKIIMRENKLRMKKQQDAAELAKLQKEEQERKTLELKKQNQQQLYNQYFKPYNNNKDKIERSLSRGKQSSKNTQRVEQAQPSNMPKPGLPPTMPRSSSKQQITNIHQKPPLPQPTETYPPRDYGSNIVKNQWLDKYAGDMKDLLGLEMSGSFEQMEQMVNEEFEQGAQKPQSQMLHEDKYTDQPSLDLTSIKHDSGPEAKPQKTASNGPNTLKLEAKDIGAKIFDCDVSVIPNKYVASDEGTTRRV